MLSVEWGFTQRQLLQDFSQIYIEQMLDYQHEKNMTQKHGD